jgi:hypothetical protein
MPDFSILTREIRKDVERGESAAVALDYFKRVGAQSKAAAVEMAESIARDAGCRVKLEGRHFIFRSVGKG